MHRFCGHIVQVWLVLIVLFGGIAWYLGPQFPDVHILGAPILAFMQQMQHAQLPVLIIAPSGGAMIVCVLLMQRAFRHTQRADHERTWRSAQQQARAELAYEIRMLEHGPLKGHVREAQRLLSYAMSALEPGQETLQLRLVEVEYSLQRLLRLVIDLHGQAEARTSAGDRGTLLPSDFQRTVLEMTRNFGKLTLCRAEFAGQTPSTIVPKVSSTLLLALSNALTNALDHGHAKDILVRVDYQLDSIILSIRDDGCGFDVQQARVQRSGCGLFDLENLARSLDGRLTITSAIGKGTAVTIVLPLVPPDLGWAAMSPAVPTHNAYKPPVFTEGDFDAQIFDEAPLGAGDESRGTEDTAHSTSLPVCHTARAHANPGCGRSSDGARSNLQLVEPPWLQRDRR